MSKRPKKDLIKDLANEIDVFDDMLYGYYFHHSCMSTT